MLFTLLSAPVVFGLQVGGFFGRFGCKLARLLVICLLFADGRATSAYCLGIRRAGNNVVTLFRLYACRPIAIMHMTIGVDPLIDLARQCRRLCCSGDNHQQQECSHRIPRGV